MVLAVTVKEPDRSCSRLVSFDSEHCRNKCCCPCYTVWGSLSPLFWHTCFVFIQIEIFHLKFYFTGNSKRPHMDKLVGILLLDGLSLIFWYNYTLVWFNYHFHYLLVESSVWLLTGNGPNNVFQLSNDNRAWRGQLYHLLFSKQLQPQFDTITTQNTNMADKWCGFCVCVL